jgi:prepilin-type processing-associated H-X9-DG protein
MTKVQKRIVGCIIAVTMFLLVAAIVLPSIGGGILGPTGGGPSSDLSQIAMAFVAYRNSGPGGELRNLPVKLGDSAHVAAFYLAKKERMYDASYYIFNGDPLAPQTIPDLVLLGNPQYSQRLAPNFAQTTLSIVMAANISLNAPLATTPLAWTRGLRADGTWSPDSPWSGRGGHIAFLDGHVEWYDKIYANATQGPTLFKYGTNQPTTNIHEALPPGAFILGAEPRPFVPEDSAANLPNK